MKLYEGNLETSYKIRELQTDDRELNSFLFSLGCYEEETVTVVSKRKNNLVIAVKDGRYNIDKALAEIIEVS